MLYSVVCQVLQTSIMHEHKFKYAIVKIIFNQNGSPCHICCYNNSI